jgi:hypothetical protein
MMLIVVIRTLAASPKALASPTFSLPPLTYAVLSDGPAFVDWVYTLTDRMRACSLVFSIIMFLLYDQYHQQTALHRWKNSSGQLGEQSSDRSFRPSPLAMFDYLALPAGIVYGIIPQIHAQFMHLFTNRLVYTVSFKPMSKGRPERDLEKALPV